MTSETSEKRILSPTGNVITYMLFPWTNTCLVIKFVILIELKLIFVRFLFWGEIIEWGIKHQEGKKNGA